METIANNTVTGNNYRICKRNDLILILLIVRKFEEHYAPSEKLNVDGFIIIYDDFIYC